VLIFRHYPGISILLFILKLNSQIENCVWLSGATLNTSINFFFYSPSKNSRPARRFILSEQKFLTCSGVSTHRSTFSEQLRNFCSEIFRERARAKILLRAGRKIPATIRGQPILWLQSTEIFKWLNYDKYSDLWQRNKESGKICRSHKEPWLEQCIAVWYLWKSLLQPSITRKT